MVKQNIEIVTENEEQETSSSSEEKEYFSKMKLHEK